jgi:hypothetical protein
LRGHFHQAGLRKITVNSVATRDHEPSHWRRCLVLRCVMLINCFF